VAGKESAEAETDSECTCFDTGAEVQVRLDFTWTAEKSSASSYSTKHFTYHCPLSTAIGAVYARHASRPAVRYATAVSSGLYRPARHSKVSSSANERRVVPITNERQGTWNCGFSSHYTQQSTQCHALDQSTLVRPGNMGCPRGSANVYAMHERLPFRSPSPRTT